MVDDYILILTIIMLLSIVQSIFGIGILMFGTPILLLMGYDFTIALGFLLPASLSVSLLQVITFQGQRPSISPYLYLLCLPTIMFGLWLVGSTSLTSVSHYFVGGILIMSAFIRFNSQFQSRLTILLTKHIPIYHLILGLVHGLTNLGGALLTILASCTSKDKTSIRYIVAHYYLLFSLTQLFVLYVIVKVPNLFSSNLFTGILSACVYQLVGNQIFIHTNNNAYQIALNIFIFICGLAILFNA